ncbi:lens fiber major intrinsic protein-like [Clytia hemisphaerica]|uniref:Aquaporin n=1 Tax=Clytia hemisphaerica TaxID=252671 RepID=A0A7M5UM32_9CNID
MSGEEGESKVSTYETYVSTPSERTVLLVKARGETWRDKIGLYEPTEPNFWRYVFAEFVYTLIFTIIACGCSLNLGQPRSDLHQAVCVGGIVAVLITVSAEKLGYFNPALSFGLLVAGEIKFVRFFVYAAVQVAGSCAGAGLLYLYTPSNVRGHLGTLSIHDDLLVGVAFVVELTLTFIVMLVIIAARDPDNQFSLLQSNMVVGLSVAVAMLMGMPFTGAGVNPIRAFGPAAVTGNLVHEHWVYWVGPLVGALCASLSYKYIFKLGEEKPKEKAQPMPTVHMKIKSTSNSSV